MSQPFNAPLKKYTMPNCYTRNATLQESGVSSFKANESGILGAWSCVYGSGVLFTQPHVGLFVAPGDFYLVFFFRDGDMVYDVAELRVDQLGGGIAVEVWEGVENLAELVERIGVGFFLDLHGFNFCKCAVRGGKLFFDFGETGGEDRGVDAFIAVEV